MIKIAVLLGIFAFFGMFAVFSNDAFALCAVNDDWPDAPCFDTMPVNGEEYRTAWAPYYDYKDSEWMETKKAELLQAITDGTFMKWENSSENSNVYQYYHSIGVVPNQYEYFFFDDGSLLNICGDEAFLIDGVCALIHPKSPSDEEVFSFQVYLLAIFSFIVGLPIIGVVYWWKKKKLRMVILPVLIFISALLLLGFFFGTIPNAIA